MKRWIRKSIIGTASVLALGIGGTVLDYAADPGDANAGNMPAASETVHSLAAGAKLWKDDVRWAQVELRYRGLYNGSLDGVVGAQTARALRRFQENNGLDRTAALDPQTMQALTGYPEIGPEIGQGSSTPADTDGAGSTTTSSGASNLGN
ncbi:MAG TPA: peptidoglycan-binding domain-containing protein [Stellaceae bacterium]